MMHGLFLAVTVWLVCLAPLASAQKAKYSVTTVKPSVCPVPTPAGKIQFHTNKTASEQLGARIAFYNSTKSPIQQLLYTVTNTSNMGQVLINFGYGSRLTATTEDGSTVQYSPGTDSITIIDPGCKISRIYTNTSAANRAASNSETVPSENQSKGRRDDPQVTVTVDLTDYCGFPISSAAPQLACTPIMYPPGQGGGNPVMGHPEYSTMDGGRRGRYVGYCSISKQLAAANHAYDICHDGVDKTLVQLHEIKGTASKAKNFLKVLSKVYTRVSEVATKIAGPLGEIGLLLDFIDLPPVQDQFYKDSCALPDDFILGLKEKSFSQSIGTVVAKLTSTRVQAGVPTCVAGGSCSCIAACNAAGTCGCAEVDYGNSPPVCLSPGPCDGDSCNSSGDCPSGQVCLTRSCCGGGICVAPRCSNSRSVSNIFGQEQERMMFENVSSE